MLPVEQPTALASASWRARPRVAVREGPSCPPSLQALAQMLGPSRAMSQLQDWSEWVLSEAGRSAWFAAAVEQLCQMAQAPHGRTTGPLGGYSYAELLFLRPTENPRKAGVYKHAKGSGNYHYKHVANYLSSLHKLAARPLGSRHLYAEALHDHVRGGRLLRLPLAGHPVRLAAASPLAAIVTGASWGFTGATAVRQFWRDHRPPGPSNSRSTSSPPGKPASEAVSAGGLTLRKHVAVSDTPVVPPPARPISPFLGRLRRAVLEDFESERILTCRYAVLLSAGHKRSEIARILDVETRGAQGRRGPCETSR